MFWPCHAQQGLSPNGLGCKTPLGETQRSSQAGRGHARSFCISLLANEPTPHELLPPRCLTARQNTPCVSVLVSLRLFFPRQRLSEKSFFFPPPPPSVARSCYRRRAWKPAGLVHYGWSSGSPGDQVRCKLSPLIIETRRSHLRPELFWSLSHRGPDQVSGEGMEVERGRGRTLSAQVKLGKRFFSSISLDGFALSIRLQLCLSHFKQTESTDDFYFFFIHQCILSCSQKAKSPKANLEASYIHCKKKNKTSRHVKMLEIELQWASWTDS